MAMKIPMGNPFGVGITPQSTQTMGLVATPETDHSPDKLAAKLDQAGEQITKSALAWQQEQNNTRVQMFANDINELANDLESNPETGFSKLQGRNATERPGGKDMPTEVVEAFDARVAALMQNMSPVARKAAQQIADATRINLQSRANKHLIEQAAVVKQHENARTFNTVMINAQSDDEQTRNSAFAVGRAMADEDARERGIWPPDYSKTLGVMHSTRIETLVDDKRIDEAKAWLKANKGEMSAAQYKASKELIEKGVDSKHAADLGSKIIASGKSDSEMLRAVEDVDPKHRGAVRKIVQSHITTQEAIKRQDVQDLVTNAWSLIANGGELPLSMETDLEAKAPQKLISMRKYMDSRHYGKKVKTDRGTFDWLWSMSQDPEQAARFASLNLIEYSGELSQADLVRFTNMQKGIAKEDRKAFMAAVDRQIVLEQADKHKHEIRVAALSLWNSTIDEGKVKTVPAAQRDAMVLQLFQDTGSGWFSREKQWEAINESPDKKPNAAVSAAMYGATVETKEVEKFLRAKKVDIPAKWTEKSIKAAYNYTITGYWPAEVRKAAMKLIAADRDKPENKGAEDLKNPSQEMINFYCKQAFARGKF